MSSSCCNDPCNTVDPQQPDCNPYCHDPECCVNDITIKRDVCPVKVHVPCCVPDPYNSCDPCDCIPCFNVDELAMTAEAKAAVMQMLDALLQTLSPVDRCGCEVIDQVGHDIPLKPTQKRDPETGAFLFLQQNADGTITETTSAINPTTQQPNQPAFDNLCCNGGSRNSAFLKSGTSSIRYKGGNHPGMFGGFSGSFDSREFHDRVGELFCCAKDKLAQAPEMIVEPVTPPAPQP